MNPNRKRWLKICQRRRVRGWHFTPPDGIPHRLEILEWYEDSADLTYRCMNGEYPTYIPF